MKQEIKDKWLAALPNYEQGTGVLKEGDKFCCLGVLCDIYIKENPGANWGDRDTHIGDGFFDSDEHIDGHEDDILPRPVMEWAGLPESDIKLRVYDEESDSYKTRYASGLNDTGASFATIRDLLEEQVEGV